MVKIRLKRMGARKRPVYRLVVADSRSPRDGRFIEEIGFYDPLPDPARVMIDADKVRHWLSRGARPSEVARKLLEREGVLPRSPRPAAARGGATGAAKTAPPAEGGAPAGTAATAEE